MTVGAGGVAPTTPGQGGSGGTSSFGSFVSASGGTGGGGGTAVVPSAGGAGGSGAGGDINDTGSCGTDCVIVAARGGDGGGPGGGRGTTGALTGIGASGVGGGGGGGGCSIPGGGVGASGGNGAAGMVVVEVPDAGFPARHHDAAPQPARAGDRRPAMSDDTAEFTPYIARDRRVGPVSYDFWICDPVAQAWYGGADHMMPEKAWCLQHVRPGMVVADCGAHHGQTVLMFARAVGPRGHVFCWEALAENALIVERNVALNALANVTVRPCALGARAGWVAFTRNSNNVMLAPMPPERWYQRLGRLLGADRPAAGERLRVVALDRDLPARTRIDFLKIDVEGADLEVLRGARRVLAQHPVLDLELHNFAFGDPACVLAAICAELAPLRYRYELLAEIDGSVEPLGTTLDPARLGRSPNPHLFAIPL